MTDPNAYDLVILGGGAAAFAALTEADRRGRETAMVNTGLPLGGTCVNVGCVPSKHLLAMADTATVPRHNSFDGVEYGDDEPTVDWEAALDEKDALVADLRQENYVDVAQEFEADVYEGYGEFVDDATIAVVDGEDEGVTITGEKALVATGSSPRIPPIDGIEDVEYETSETVLERRNLPESVVVIGGGYVALEWGQILHRVGVETTLLQRSGRVLSGMEPQLGREIQRHLRAEGIAIETDVDVERLRSAAASENAPQGGVAVETETGGEARTFTAAELFVATGVEPNTEAIGLDAVGIETNDRDAVAVDEYFQTANPDVYAAGDVVGDPQLETVAAKEGNHAVRNALGDEGRTIDYGAVPAVVYTDPEVATVGVTEREYAAEHGTCSCRTVQMEDESKARAVNDTRGLLKVVKHHETDEIVGVQVVGPRAADVIPEATLAVKFGLTVNDIIDTIHPFPTFSEAFKHACQAFRRDRSSMSCCIE